MQLSRAKPARPLISLVSMIDVLLIMLVFFMVTSTYLNLDMIPMVETAEDEPVSGATASSEPQNSRATLLLSLSADGRITLSGQSLTLDQLRETLEERVALNADVQVLILPSGHAKAQALVSAMDTVTTAGITSLRIVELEARP